MYAPWWFMLSMLFCLVLIISMVFVSSPGLMVGSFLVIILNSVCCLFIILTDLWAYYLFLIYVGGLLVLLSYMIMLSSNQIFDSRTQVWAVSGSAILLMVGPLLIQGHMSGLSLPLNSCIVKMEYSCLILLGLLLLYIFMSVCNIILVGGRAFKF